ncbi:UDP-Glycosyltransferase/glycogen phosphorylase [Exidia glandulosa HHB12029]|uniref:UDP-Glycosyltransferase/glycogen phosphorylase n=1 Tax=Exidia glandulosa HHB12029 TaxID=1314781 RepID=A0A165PID0_EXIGL|nr:UDP-Glycosyltransferase/glycogen phosphorylase [Exidia glandulosa HHB12029]
MGDPKNAPHVVLASTPIWSHFRTMCILAARLAAERPIVVTVLVPHWAKTFDLVNAETERFLRDIPNPRGTLRIIALGSHSLAREPIEILTTGDTAFPAVWDALCSGREVECSATHKIHEPAAVPAVIVLDMFLYAWHPTLRKVSPDVPLLWYNSGTAAGIGYLVHPGGRYGDSAASLGPEDPDRSPEFTGRVVKLPGLPAMHDWEFVPQRLEGFDNIKFENVIARSLYASDGIASSCALAFDGEEAVSALSSVAAERGKPAFHLGPLLPFQDGTTKFSRAALEAEIATAPPGIAATIQDFLDKHRDAKGACSVVYICFGTHYWPENNLEHLWALLDTLTDRDIPFILSHASPKAQIPDDVRKRYADSVAGLLVPWSPQQTVLTHEAIGWFVTHGGAGGTMDALTQGIPLIGWPAFGDQPSNIAYLTHTADVAFELVEVRTGEHGLKPLRASGKTPKGTVEAFREELQVLLDDMAGDVGARKRENARKRQAELQKAWSAGGPARVAFDNFVQHYKL